MRDVIIATITNLNLDGLPHASADGGAVQTVLSIVIGITAAISLLFITIGGLRYILSQGDPQGISKAKGTIVYALIGLVIAIAAQAIVVFVVKGVQ
jgi:hypothetical protein